MNDPYSPRDAASRFPESAMERDLRLQADPELAAGEGRASSSMIMIYFAAMVFAVCVVLYGLNRQDGGASITAATTAAPMQTAQVAPPESTTPKRELRDGSNQQKNGPQGEPKEPQQGQSGGGQQGSTPGPK